MKVTQCQNGHFYDGDKFASCPHCSTAAEDTVPVFNDPVNVFGNSAPPLTSDPVGFNNDVTRPDDEVTVSYTEAAQDEKTVAMWEEPADAKNAQFIPSVVKQERYAPVVGWLVCIDGVERGRDYRLHGGRNFIGRSLQMDVSIPDDPKLSRDNHASIIYDARSHKYFALPGETSHTTLNGVSLDAPAALIDGDFIECGGSKLCFISFCKEGRTW